nr:MAG TPA: hypothetical protein [Caudoviricetes sp.]
MFLHLLHKNCGVNFKNSEFTPQKVWTLLERN